MGKAEDGRRVVLSGVLPGELVRVAVDHEGQDGTVYGRLRGVDTASTERIDPVCPHFLTCGGCDFLHWAEAPELAFKRRRVAEALGVDLEKTEAIVPSPRSLHYRAVAKLVFGPHGRLGSYAPRSHRVIDMGGCRVHAPVIERVADALRRALNGGTPSEGARYLVLRAALPRSVVHATLVVRTAGCPAELPLVKILASHPEVAEVWRHTNRAEGDGIFDPQGATVCLHRGSEAVGAVGSAEQHIASGAFAQVNPGAAERLYARVAELAEPEDKAILDLYSGSGGIALTLAAHGAREVLGIEREAAAVEAARRAAKAFGGRVRFASARAEDTKAFLRDVDADAPVPGEGGGFATWVVNPPRKGLATEVVAALRVLRPERIVYVSCDPDRLARDVEALEAIYTVDRIIPVDMFPQTRHVETVVRLRLRAALLPPTGD